LFLILVNQLLIFLIFLLKPSYFRALVFEMLPLLFKLLNLGSEYFILEERV